MLDPKAPRCLLSVSSETGFILCERIWRPLLPCGWPALLLQSAMISLKPSPVPGFSAIQTLPRILLLFSLGSQAPCQEVIPPPELRDFPTGLKLFGFVQSSDSFQATSSLGISIFFNLVSDNRPQWPRSAHRPFPGKGYQ